VTNGKFDNATLISIMKNHIQNVVTHFKGKCYCWDVVNEALNEDGTYRSSGSVWGSTIGPAFIPIAFSTAAMYDPGAKLYYNDYNCDKPGAKATGAQNLIRMVKSYGAPIHGFGMQGHMTAGQVGAASQYVTNMEAFTSLGVEVAYTELDISTPSSSPNLQQQATDYTTVVDACKQVDGCVGITIWEFSDKYTWLSNSEPLLWDSNLQKKPAYTAVLSAWGSAAATATKLPGAPGGGFPASSASTLVTSVTTAPASSATAVNGTATSSA
jgi:endo-1,4-beta-xylanase